ncbi:MAG: outer membrane lipoprotein carrier protein LolA [Bacteroidota bacterium]
MYKKILLTFGVLSLANFVFAQQDPQARAILDAMSSTYQEISSFQAELAYTMTNKMEGINESYNGKISVKGDMYRLEMQDQEIYNDGTTVWTYLSDIPEVTIDDNNPEGGDITPSSIFNIYKEGYKYLYLNTTTIAGKSYDIVDLVPNDKNAQYFKVRLEIGSKDRLLRSFTLFDKEGSEYTYLISNFKSNVNLPDTHFKFDTSQLSEDEIIDIR